MSSKSKDSTTGGLGARYGTSVRKRVSRIGTQVRQKHECFKCGKVAVKRVSVGVWRCDECGSIFAGGAYTPATKVGTVARRGIRQS
ncbi:MAG: 50S ribosomal protein L37ae [Candidatus Bathyarchaeia archaeon]